MKLLFRMDEENEIDVKELLNVDEIEKIIAIVTEAYKRQYGKKP